MKVAPGTYLGKRNMKKKNKGVAYLFWLLGIFGLLGLQRFYLGKIGSGIIWLITWGVCGFGALYDLFTLGKQVREYNMEIENQQFRQDMRDSQMQTQTVLNATIAQSLLKEKKD